VKAASFTSGRFTESFCSCNFPTGNVSETEEDFCSVDLDEGTDIGSNHSSPVEFGGKSEVEEDSESLGGDKKHSDQTTDQDH